MGEAPRNQDLFSIEAERGSIPAPVEVLPPPEEIRRRKLVRIAIVVTSVVVVILIALTVRYFVHAAAVERSALAAGDYGGDAEIVEALETLDSGEAPGLRARLVAMRAFAGDETPEAARAAIDEVPADDPHEASERVKATVYLALARGEYERAGQAAAQLIAQGTFGAETAYVRGIAAFARGDLASARAEASAAVSVRADAPRYVALLARASAMAGDAAAGRAALSELEDMDATGALQVANVEVALREGRFAEAEAAATAGLATERPSPRERAWLAVLQAEAALGRGRPLIARERASALASRPANDEHLAWRLAAVFARAQDAAAAAAIYETLPATGPLAEPHLRSFTRAAAHLARRDARTALAELESVPAFADSLMLVGLAHRFQGLALDSRDELLSAQNAFARVAELPTHAALGGAHRAEMSARLELDAAAAQAAAALEADPEHPEVVAAVARTRLVLGQPAEALAAVDALLSRDGSLSQHVELLRGRGKALEALERWEDAAAALRGAVVHAPRDVELQSALGHVAHELDQTEESRRAYEAALAVAPADIPTLRGFITLLLDLGEVAAAEAPMDRLEAQRLRDQDFHRLQARYLVASGAGYGGMRAVQAGMSRFRRDGTLRTAMAELLLQAALYGRSAVMFQRAVSLGEDRIDSYVGAAMAHAMDGKNNRVNQVMGDLRSALADTEGGPPDFSERPRYLALRARVELNLGRIGPARSFAERAIAADATTNEAHLVLADVESRRRRGNPTPHLEAAAGGPRAQLPAIGRLALAAGETSAGCALAERYRRGRPRGDLTDDIRALLSSATCE